MGQRGIRVLILLITNHRDRDREMRTRVTRESRNDEPRWSYRERERTKIRKSREGVAMMNRDEADEDWERYDDARAIIDRNLQPMGCDWTERLRLLGFRLCKKARKRQKQTTSRLWRWVLTWTQMDRDGQTNHEGWGDFEPDDNEQRWLLGFRILQIRVSNQALIPGKFSE